MVFSLNQQQKDKFYEDGYLVLKNFFTQEQAAVLLKEARDILSSFSLSDHPLTQFKTGEDDHVGDAYFLESATKVSTFFEPESFDKEGHLLRSKETSVNKIGHALHELSPPFRKFTLENQDLRALSKDLNYHSDPRVLQSMIICKQPRIGAAVSIHDDNTFLYTRPCSALGYWYALEACTKTNGCLSFLPGSHRRNKVPKRFVRKEEGGTGFESTGNGTEDIDWSTEEGWKVEECDVGTLVLIDGSVIHKSEKNLSDKSRFIYTHHCIEGAYEYDERNWLQPTADMPFSRLYA